MPKDETFCVAKTTDGGKSFRQITRGLPAKPTFDLVLRHAMDVDRGGDRPAFGSTTGNLWTSSDGGGGGIALRASAASLLRPRARIIIYIYQLVRCAICRVHNA